MLFHPVHHQAPSGATQNAELVSAAQEALQKIQNMWPGIETDSALGLGKGGQQVACMKIRGKIILIIDKSHIMHDVYMQIEIHVCYIILSSYIFSQHIFPDNGLMSM